MRSIEKRIKEVIVEQFNVRMEEVSNSSSFIEDLGADEMDVVGLIMAFETEFDKYIPYVGAEFTTVQKAINYITNHN